MCYARQKFQLLAVVPDEATRIVNESKTWYIQIYNKMINLNRIIITVSLAGIYSANHTFVHWAQCLVSSVGNVTGILKLKIPKRIM